MKKKRKYKGSKGGEAAAARRQPRKGRRFTLGQRKEALDLIAAGMDRERVAKVIGTTTESLRRWVKHAVLSVAVGDGIHEGSSGAAVKPGEDDAQGRQSIYAPKDPGQGLSEPEVAEILALKKRHPGRGNGWRRVREHPRRGTLARRSTQRRRRSSRWASDAW